MNNCRRPLGLVFSLCVYFYSPPVPPGLLVNCWQRPGIRGDYDAMIVELCGGGGGQWGDDCELSS